MNLRSEPVMTVTVASAIVIECLGLVVAVAVARPRTRSAIIWSVTGVVGAMVLVGLIVRQLVYAPRTMDAIRYEAERAGIKFGVTRPGYAYRRIRGLPDSP